MVTVIEENLEGLVAPILSGPDWTKLPNVFKITETTDTKIFQCPSRCTAEITVKIKAKKLCSMVLMISTVESYKNIIFDSQFEMSNVTIGPGQSIMVLTDDIGNGIDLKVSIDGKLYGPVNHEKIL